MIQDLTINDVSVSTATVDIQVMRIGSKQMTLAVFRQLQQKEIFNEDGTLAANPWGWVNYDSSLNRETDQHFIYSYDGVLYRNTVYWRQYANLDFATPATRIHYKNHAGKLIPEEWYCTPDRYERNRWHLSKPVVAKISGALFHKYDRSYDYHCENIFASESEARIYLANLRNSIAILRSAPQLFIGV